MSEAPGMPPRLPSGTIKTKRKIDFEALVKADEEDFLRKQALAAREWCVLFGGLRWSFLNSKLEAKAKQSENVARPQLTAVTTSTRVTTNSGSATPSVLVSELGILPNMGQEQGAEVAAVGLLI